MFPEPRALVTARQIRLVYTRRRMLRAVWRTQALDDIDLDLFPNEILGLTGPSGCGKSSLARVIAGIQKPDSGVISAGTSVQMVFQDPGASLNPRFRAHEIVEEPLAIARVGKRRERAAALLRKVGLDPVDSGRRSGEFSGGERARLAIARALAAMPRGAGVVIFDESLSSLDGGTLNGILELLESLRAADHLTYVIISHDLCLLKRLATRVMVMDSGRIVDQGPPNGLFSHPAHPATARLVECTPEVL